MKNGNVISLHGLAKDNKVDEMIKLMSSREKINAKDKLHRTALHLACFFGSLDAARLLIENGADVNAIAQDNVRPLGFGVMKGNIDIVRLLLSNGASTGINSIFQKNAVSCLHIAVKGGNKDLVSLLLENGCNPNIRNKTHKLAIEETNNEEIKAMIEEYTKKWNEEKKKKANDRRRRKQGDDDKANDKDSEDEPPMKIITHKSKRLKQEPKEGESSNHTETDKPISAPKSIIKKLDLKTLAFMLNQDDELLVCSR